MKAQDGVGGDRATPLDYARPMLAACRPIPFLALVACQVYRQSPSCDKSSIRVEPTSLDFGAVVVGQSATDAFQLAQDYCGAVELEAVSLSGSLAFTLVLQDAGEASFLGGGASSVRFAPTAIGTFDALLIINTSSSSDPVLELSLAGQGVSAVVGCRTDGDCDGGGFCDGTSCQPSICGPFDNLPDLGGGAACAPESRACRGDAGWELVDSLSDPRNCGACGQACASGSGCSGGRCGSCPSYRIGDEQDYPIQIPRFDAGDGVILVGLALGDFDGDGHPDVLLDLDTRFAGRSGTTLSSSALLISNDGQGGFGSAPRPVSLCSGPLRVGDFNGDCALDVAAAGAILLNDGHGNFPRRNNTPLDFNVDLLVRDVNQDGTPDLIFGGMYESPAAGPLIAYGDGRGAFSPPASFAKGLELYALTGGNFNGNGRPGVAGYAFDSDAGPLYCFANEDAGSLALEADYPDPLDDAGGLPASFAAGDVTGSGHDALVYGEGSSVVVVPNPGSGAANALLVGLDTGFAELTVGDLDLDGHADLLATEGRGSREFGFYSAVYVPDGGFSLDLWTGFGEDGGRLTAARLQARPTNFPASFLQIADLNGDGIPDILAVSAEYSLFPGDGETPRVMVFLGTCP